MDVTKVGLWIQAATVASVILGIGLVVWELRQQREFAETQHVTDNSSWYSTSVQSTMGENPAASIAVACDNPDQMSTENMVVMMSYYKEILYRVRHQYDLESVTSLKTFGCSRTSQTFYGEMMLLLDPKPVNIMPPERELAHSL